ncbi:LysR family transcriptional regulator [Roseovarius sp. SCSIO 43702]|uniref:LysR family transcriptional regulator n=1 Tax=Roseovarius sp. SCSIO 43702 TaxID=2823043 RepID=UPI001C72B784|nr:LysR family transcriptional regulator [Roseovarius sp. SCSIO 43702]QYX55360.1 LysR family transcriptional regulator [Roseovarius sp. SCSIO 43702]
MAELSLDTISLEWIRAFESAGRTGSFTAAATETGLTQAAISQRITHLERRLGTQLFVRNARGVTLSVDGESWLPYVTAALRDLGESCEAFFGLDRRKVSISASASVTALWLAPRLARWQGDDRPEIAFSTMVLQSESQHLDATIRVRYGVGDWGDHHKVPLFAEAIGAVAAPHLLREGAAWQTLPRLALSGPRAGWPEWARQTGDPMTPVPSVRFDSLGGALAAAEAGAGVLLASLPLCRDRLAAGSLVQVSDAVLTPPETYWMIARKDALTGALWRRLSERFAEG